MGSFCKPSKVESTSSQTSSTAPQDYIAKAYKKLVPQLQKVASTKYNPATQQRVAGFAAPQFQAFQGVENMQGAYQPYMDAAGSYTGLGALPVTANVGAYMNPFIGNVVDASLNDWQEMSRRQMQDVNSNAAKVGALTGDRSQVAQQLAREAGDRAMASNISGLYSQGYTQALGAAQADASRALQAGQQFAGLGGLAQQYGYQDVNALLGIGGMQQGLQQQQYDAATQNAIAKSQYPFTTAQWLTSNLTGLGGAAGSTTTGTGTQVQPGPSPFQQVLGAATAAASFFKDGGRVGYADGGSLPYGKGLSYISAPEVARGGLQSSPFMSMPQAPPASSGMDDLLSSYKQAKSALGGLENLGTKLRTSVDGDSGWSTTVNPSGLSGWGNYLSNGMSGLGGMFGFRHGGRVGYADGGEIEGDDDWMDDYYGDESVVGTGPVDAPAARVVAIPPAEATGLVSLPEPRQPTKGLLGLEMSDPVRRGLMTAGFGMMASSSPNWGTAIGQGGLAGVKAYHDALSDEDKLALERSELTSKAAQAAQRNATARARVAAAEEMNRIRKSQADAMLPYRAAQIENMQSLAEQREFKKRLFQSLGIGAPPEGEEGSGGILPQSNAVDPAAAKFQNASDPGPDAEGPARFADPNIQLVDDRAAPDAKAEAAPQSGGMITLPNGKKLSPDEAMRMGMGLLLDPDTAALGKFLMEQAQSKIGGPSTMGQPAKNTLEEKSINTMELLSRLDQIGKQYNEEYLRAGTQVGQWWNEMRSKFQKDALTPEQKDDLVKATAFRATALDNVNQYIKEITGAAMTIAEAERILKTQPNPGMGVMNGIWDADGPDVFKAKLDNMVNKSRLALVRYNYLRRNGFNGSVEEAAKELSLEGMEKVVNRRASEIRQNLLRQNPKFKDADVMPIVRREMKKEFGLEI